METTASPSRVVLCTTASQPQDLELPESRVLADHAPPGPDLAVYELATAVAQLGREVELRGLLNESVLDALAQTSGAAPRVDLPARRPELGDIVILPQGIHPAIPTGVYLSGAHGVLFASTRPVMDGSILSAQVNAHSTVQLLDKDSLECALVALGFSVWTDMDEVAVAAQRLGADAHLLGHAAPINSPQFRAQCHDIATLDGASRNGTPSQAPLTAERECNWQGYIEGIREALDGTLVSPRASARSTLGHVFTEQFRQSPRQPNTPESAETDFHDSKEVLDNLIARRDAEAAAARRHIEFLERSQTTIAEELDRQTAEIAAMQATKLFRYSRGIRRVYAFTRRRPPDRVLQAAESEVHLVAGPGIQDASYENWVRLYDTMTDERRRSIAARLRNLPELPQISVLLPAFNTPEPLLRRAIDSVIAQIYPHWELCVVDDASTDPTVSKLLNEYEARDQRIRTTRRPTNGHISAATNSAIEIATGSWLAPLDHDDELSEHALAMVALTLAKNPDAGLVYSDEDKIDFEGRRHAPYFKPDFDPLLLLGQNYLCHLTVLRRDLVHRAGGYREGFEGSQDWDLALRISELLSPDSVLHIPHILYHWRTVPGSTATQIREKPYAIASGRRTVTEHLSRQGRKARVLTNPITGWNRIKWELPPLEPMVNIVIPTRDGASLTRCIDSLFRLTTYSNYDVTVIDNGSLDHGVLEYLRKHDTFIHVLRDERAFNYSALNNRAVSQTNGPVICLLNDDCEITSGDWLEEMTGHLLQPKIGAVGAKLLYPDGRIQHAGVVLGIGGAAGHVFKLSERAALGYRGRLQLAQCFSAVTAACVLVRREAWDQVRGLNEKNLAINFNDIDLCLRIQDAGWRIVWTPFAELVHHESLTRGMPKGDKEKEFEAEREYLKQRWGERLRTDPAYNPNLTLVHGDSSLAWPPRVSIL